MTNKSISQLTAGGAVSATDLFPDVQTVGVGPVRVTAAQIGDYVLSGSGLTGVLPVSRGGTGLTSLTAGRIPYGAGGSGTDPFGNSANLFWDAANSRLGIGTATPGYTLSVTGATNSTNAYFYNGLGQSAIRIETGANDKAVVEQYTNGNGNWRIGPGITVAGAYEINSVTAGATRMLIDASGNLGLGVTPSAWDAASGQRAFQLKDYVALWQGGNGSSNLGFNTFEYGGNLYKYIGSTFASRYSQLAGEHRWFTAPSGTAGNAISFTQAMTLDASGNLGIGTSSPGTKLNVYTGSATNTLIRPQNTLGYADFGPLSDGSIYGPYCAPAASTNLTIGTSNANPIRFLTSGSERARIDSSGNVGIGTTTINAKLQFGNTVGSAGGANMIRLYEAGSAIFGFGVAAGELGYRGSAHVFYSDTGTERARIDSSGNIICGTAAIATNATNGFLYVPGCAGTPTGTPTTVTGRSPIVVDTTNNKLYFYSGGQWRDAGP